MHRPDVPSYDPLRVLLVSGDVPDVAPLRFARVQQPDPLVLPAIRIFNRVHCIVPQALPALFVVFVYNLFPALHLRPRIVVRFELVKVASALQLSQRNSTFEHGIHERSVAFRQFQLPHHAVKRFLLFLDFRKRLFHRLNALGFCCCPQTLLPPCMRNGFRALRKVQLTPKLEQLFLKVSACLHFDRRRVLAVELVQRVFPRFYAVVLIHDLRELILRRGQ